LTASTQPRPTLRPFHIIGFSTSEGVFCPSCASRAIPNTGEKVSHICRRGPRPVPDKIRNEVLALDAKKIRPGKIADHLRISLPTVMRVLTGDSDDGSCPACEAATRSEDREVLPLYYADTTTREETCTHCGHSLVDLAVQTSSERMAGFHVEHTTSARGHPALQFDRRPPEHSLLALKTAGWRWHARERIWVDYSRKADVPPSILITPKPTPVNVTARPPVIRRRWDLAATATLH